MTNDNIRWQNMTMKTLMKITQLHAMFPPKKVIIRSLPWKLNV